MSIDLHDFPAGEYDHRQNRAKELMDKKGLDALLVTDASNYRLLSGARPGTKNRPVILILPREGDIVLVVNSINESYTRRYTWIKDIRTYGLPFNLDSVKHILMDLGLAGAKIGVELTASWFPSFIASKMQQETPKTKVIDASDILYELRVIKTDAEVQCLRKVCKITGKAYERLFETIKEGMTENEVAKTLFDCFMKEGADLPLSTFLLIHSGGEYVGAPTDKPLRKGDLLWFDSGCSYKGYHSDFGRSGVVGTPSKEQRETFDSIIEITDKCVKAIRPGIKLNEVHKAGVKACKDLGLDPNMVSGALAKRRPHIGHSMGLEAVEPPMIDPWDETIIKPNMILTIEPAIFKPNGVFHTEQDVVVTEDGCEILSEVSIDLFKIAKK